MKKILLYLCLCVSTLTFGQIEGQNWQEPNCDECVTVCPPDGDPCTDDLFNDVSCECQYIFIDYDNDGICAAEDCDDMNPDNAEGSPCNDNNPCTKNDMYIDCECVGEIIDCCIDCLEESVCDDNNPCTKNDAFDSECNCAGIFIDGCQYCVTGASCDDGDACTSGDSFDENCNCIGLELVPACTSLVGSSCDDGNDCTDNDIYITECHCEGTPTIELVIEVTDPNIGLELECSNGPVTLSTNFSIEEHQWFFEGILLSYESSVLASTPGSYSVIVTTENGCEFEENYFKINFDGPNDLITSSHEEICSFTQVTLTINEEFAPHVEYWEYNGMKIQGSDNKPFISHGTFSGEFKCILKDDNIDGDCPFEAVFVLKNAMGEFEIETDNPILCWPLDGGANLTIIDFDLETYSYTWSGPNGFVAMNLETTTVVDVGIYELLVYNQECYHKEYVEIGYESDLKYDEVLLQNGFVKIPIRIDELLGATGDDSSENRMTCNDIEDSQPIDYEFTFIETNLQVKFKEFFEEKRLRACEHGVDFGGILMDGFCDNNSALDFNDFVNYADENKYYLRVYLKPTTAGSLTSLYIKSNLPELASFGLNVHQTSHFYETLNQILCSKGNEDLILEDYVLDLSSWIMSAPSKLQFDGFDYVAWINNGGEDINILMQNYLEGEELNTSLTQPFESSIPFPNYGILPGQFRSISIPYVDTNLLPFKIIINASHSTYVTRLNAPNSIVDGNKNTITLINELDLLAIQPKCYINDEDICDYFQDDVLDNNYMSRQFVLDLFATENETTANYIYFDCLKDNFNVFPLQDRVFSDRKAQIQYFRSLTNLAYQLDFPNINNVASDFSVEEPYFRLEGNSVLGIGSSFSMTNGFGSTVCKENNEYNGAYSYLIQDKSFNYFDYYLVHIGDDDWRKFANITAPTHESNYLVPGFYIPLLVHLKNEENQSQNTNIVVNVATMAVGFGTLNIAIKSGRLLSLSGILGVTDIAASGAHIMLETNTFCNTLDDNTYDGFCANYKKWLPYIDFALIGGSFAALSIDDLIAVKNSFEGLGDSGKNSLRTHLKNEQGYNDVEVDELFRILANAGDLITILKTKFPGIHNYGENLGIDIFKQLVQSNQNAGKILEFEDLLNNPILWTDQNGFELMQDIISTTQVAGKLGKNLSNLTEAQMTMWQKVIAAPLHIRCTSSLLTKLGDMVDAGVAIIQAEKIGNVATLFIQKFSDEAFTIKSCEDLAIAMKNSKNNNLESYGINTDLGTSFEMLAESPHFKNTKNDIVGLTAQLRITTGGANGNPGFIEQVNEGLLRINANPQRDIYIESKNVNKQGDVVDDYEMEALQMKALTSPDKSKVGAKLKEACTQFTNTQDIPPSGYTTIADIRVFNMSNEVYNYDKVDLMDWIKTTYDLYTPEVKTIVQNTNVLSFHTGIGINQFKINVNGSVIEL